MDQLKKFEMELDRDILRLDGRTLVTEKILLGGGKVGNPGDQVDWTRDLKDSPLLHVKELNEWVVVVPTKFKRDAVAFVEILKRAVRGMKFPIRDPQMLVTLTLKNKNYF